MRELKPKPPFTLLEGALAHCTILSYTIRSRAMSYQSIPERLNEAETALHNAQTDPTLRDALADLGYDEATLEEGKSLLEAAQEAQQTMTAEYSEQYDATETLQEVHERANDTYMRFVKIARVALKNQPGATEALKLSGRRKRTLTGWLEQARTFYDNALGDDDVLEALGEYNVTSEDLQEGRAQVQAVAEANSVQEQEKGDAQDATEARDAAVDALDEWMSDFFSIARVALDDQPQQLEKLGIVVPSA